MPWLQACRFLGTSKRVRFGRGMTSWLLMPLPRVVAATTAPFAGGASVSNACIVEMVAASAVMWPLTCHVQAAMQAIKQSLSRNSRTIAIIAHRC